MANRYLSQKFLSEVLNDALAGLVTSTNAAITTSDTILTGMGKLQAQITGLGSSPNFTGKITQTTSGSLVQGTYQTQSSTGTVTYAAYGTIFPQVGWGYNYKRVLDSVVLGADEFTNFRQIVCGDVIDHAISASTVNGARIAHGAFMRVMGTVNTGGDFMGASIHFAQATFPVAGSTSTNPVGNLYGQNPQVVLSSGATNYSSIMAEEADVQASPGSSMAYKWGICIATVGDDAVHGSKGEAALHIGAVPSTGGWNRGILFSNFNGGGTPISATGTLISGNNFSGSTAITALHGVDLTSFAFNGNAFASLNFHVDGVGNLLALNASFSSVAISTGGMTIDGPISTLSGNVAFQSNVAITDNSTGGTVSQLTLTAGSNAVTGARITLTGNGATTPNKYIRVKGGSLDILNSAASAAIFSIADNGNAGVTGSMSAVGLSSSTTLFAQGNGTINGSLGVLGGIASPLGVSVIDTGTAALNHLLLSAANNTANGVILKLTGDGVTTPSKTIRVKAGLLEILNNANTAVLSITDSGITSVSDLQVNGTGGLAGAWNTTTSAVTSASGALGTGNTCSIRYKKMGRIVFVNIIITMGAAGQGTGAGSIQITLPWTTAATTVLNGAENAISGKTLSGRVASGATTMAVFNYDNTYPGANSAVLVLSGILESTT